MPVLVHDRCEGEGEQEVLAVVTDPTLSPDNQKCCQWHPDVPHEAGTVQVYTRWRKYPQAGFGLE